MAALSKSLLLLACIGINYRLGNTNSEDAYLIDKQTVYGKLGVR
jgi:hypothetical protein